MKKVGVVIRIKAKSPLGGKDATYKDIIDLRKEVSLSHRQNIRNIQEAAVNIKKQTGRDMKRASSASERAAIRGAGIKDWKDKLAEIPKEKVQEALAAYKRVYVENLAVMKIKGISAIAARQNEQYINIYAAYFQRLVSRTPIDEDYYYRTKSGRIRLHKADNDVTREDWVMTVNNTIVITSKEFGFSAFLNFNDKNTIKRIADKIESQLKNKAVLHTVSVENKNWKFPILEEGKYPTSSNKNNAVAAGNLTPKYPHGTKDGYSLQALHGIENVTKAELAMISKTSRQGYRSYMGRALKKEVDMKALKPYVKKICNQKRFNEIDEKLFMKIIYKMEKIQGTHDFADWAFSQLEKENVKVNGATFNEDTYLAKTSDRLYEKLRKNRVRKENYKAKKLGYAMSKEERKSVVQSFRKWQRKIGMKKRRAAITESASLNKIKTHSFATDFSDSWGFTNAKRGGRFERTDEYRLQKHNLKIRQRRAKYLTLTEDGKLALGGKQGRELYLKKNPISKTQSKKVSVIIHKRKKK